MRAILIHDGTEHEALLLASLAIGLQKKYVNIKILWAGHKEIFQLIKFNPRIQTCFDLTKIYDLASLTGFYECDVCINPYPTNLALRLVEICGAKQFLGFTKNGPVDHNAELFQSVLYDTLTTNITALEMYYKLANMKWTGEGYGLGYYPRKKQTKETGLHLQKPDMAGETIQMPSNILHKFDAINEYKNVITDDLFTTHAALALRKQATYHGKLQYELNFGGLKIH